MPFDIILDCRSLRGNTLISITSEKQSSRFPLESLGLRNHHLWAAPSFVLLASVGLDIPLWEPHSSAVAILSGATQNRSLVLKVLEGSHQSSLNLPFFGISRIYFQIFFYSMDFKSVLLSCPSGHIQRHEPKTIGQYWESSIATPWFSQIT